MAYSSNTGVLFRNTGSTHPQAPQITGNLELSSELIAELWQLVNNGQQAKLRLAGWRNKAKGSGVKYITLLASIPYTRKQQPDEQKEEEDPFAL